jgi:hypothetical protein
MMVEEKTGAILASPRDPFIRNDGYSGGLDGEKARVTDFTDSAAIVATRCGDLRRSVDRAMAPA